MCLQLGECTFPCSPLADAAGLGVRSPLPGCCQEQCGSLPWLSVSMAMALRHPFSTATSTYAKSGLVLGSQGGNKCSEFCSPSHAGWKVLSRRDGHHVGCTVLSCLSTSSTHAWEGWTNSAAQGGLWCPTEGLRSHLQHHLPSPRGMVGEPS